MRRRRRAPTTQLARAGERTFILTADVPVDEIRFRATTLTGAPRGRIEIETGDPLPRTADLAEENRLDARGLRRLAIIPESDTAITFLPVERQGSNWVFLVGAIVVLVAIGWTALDFVGG